MPELNLNEFVKRLTSKDWRMNNLYKIIDKDGNLVTFKLNKHQAKFIRERHGRDIILKARQLGFSTLEAIDQLDESIFGKNFSAGIVDATEDDAKGKLEKIKLAYDNLPENLRGIGEIPELGSVIMTERNATSVTFDNESKIKVGTSHRGSTLQKLHISELSKIDQVSPMKSKEILTGALQAVPKGGSVTIESTARGSDGLFHSMCIKAQKMIDKEHGPLDFKFHFFPWFEEDDYRLPIIGEFRISQKMENYFNGLKAAGVELDNEQKLWYIKKLEELGESMKEEYPSSPEEAFSATDGDKYYGDQMAKVRNDGRITAVPHEEALAVDTYWDLGVNDYTAIWFVQTIRNEVRLIDYYQSQNEGLGHYAGVLDAKGYRYGKHFAPHDIMVRNLGKEAVTRYDIARKELGLKFETVAKADGSLKSAVPNIDLADGIEATRRLLSRCWFDMINCTQGIESLEKYAKQWNEARGMYVGERKSKWNHGADALRYLAVTLKDAPQPQKSYSVAHRRHLNNPLHDANKGW